MLSLLQILIDATRKQGCGFHDRGTVVVVEGPRFSTKAESFMFRSFGASLVGMTAVPEVTYNTFITHTHLGIWWSVGGLYRSLLEIARVDFISFQEWANAMARHPSSVRLSVNFCTNHFFSRTNGRITTKLAHDGLQVSVHPGCAQGQRSRDMRTFLDSWNELLRHWRSGSQAQFNAKYEYCCCYCLVWLTLMDCTGFQLRLWQICNLAVFQKFDSGQSF